MTARAVILLIAVNLIWGGSVVVARDALDTIPSSVLAFLRVGLAALVMAPLTMGAQGVRRSGAQGVRSSPALVGALGFGLSHCLLYAGMARTTAIAAVLLVNMEAAFTAVLGVALLGERMAVRGGVGIALSSLGAALILNADRSAPGGEARLAGNLLVLGATLTEAAATVLSRPLRAHLSGFTIAGIAARWGALFLAGPALIQWLATGHHARWLTPVNGAEIAYLALGSTVLCYSIWYGLLDRVQAGSAAAFLCLQPVVAAVLAAVFRGERLLPIQGVGGGLVFLGLLLVSTVERNGKEEIALPAGE
jgi:drug/metabolite transporter (DMT)-like permease